MSFIFLIIYFKFYVIMPAKTYKASIDSAQVMLAGIRNHVQELSRRGIDVAFQTELEEKINTTIAENNEQEKRKADLKTQTAVVGKSVKKMNALVSEAQKIVKMDIPKEQWKEFGIQSKQ